VTAAMIIRAPIAADHEAMAELLVEGFREKAPAAWPTLEVGREEVAECCSRGFVYVAVDGDEIIGWIGGHPDYDGNVWELHPLVVRHDRQRHGVGRALCAAFEAEARARGGYTARLGSDDEGSWTSLGGVDLYPDIPGAIAGVTDRRGHPFRFYQKLGYVIVGVMPDASGPGKPDIIMAKRLR